MLTHLKEIVKQAQKGGYAIGAFNAFNLETTLAIVRAAKATRLPVIIQVSEKSIKYAGLKAITAIIRAAVEVESGQVPIALHLDHGKDFGMMAECIKAGFSSVHFDGSALPLEKNIALTKKAVLAGHRFGVWVQGELGSLAGREEMTKKGPKKGSELLTDPAEVKGFIKETGIDTLAISIGTKHGRFVGQEKIDFNRLKAIAKQTNVPLVLHGASGARDTEVKQAIKLGIRIVNLDTDLRWAFISALRQAIKKQSGQADPREMFKEVIEAVAKMVESKIKLFKSK